jgi:hypothetical protein
MKIGELTLDYQPMKALPLKGNDPGCQLGVPMVKSLLVILTPTALLQYKTPNGVSHRKI